MGAVAPTLRSRRAIVATVTWSYLTNWLALLAGAFVGYKIDRSHGERLEWDGLGGLIYGAFAALVVVHVVWAVARWRLLRPMAPRSVIVSVVALVPALVVATVVVLERSGADGGQLVATMALASAVYPAAAAWWATDVWLESPTG